MGPGFLRESLCVQERKVGQEGVGPSAEGVHVGVCYPWKGGCGLGVEAGRRAEAGMGQTQLPAGTLVTGGRAGVCGYCRRGHESSCHVGDWPWPRPRPRRGRRLEVHPSVSTSVGLLGQRIEPYPDVESSLRFSSS